MAGHGLKVGTGTIVDATLIEAPSSTTNKECKRDPEVHQTRKGNQWHSALRHTQPQPQNTTKKEP